MYDVFREYLYSEMNFVQLTIQNYENAIVRYSVKNSKDYEAARHSLLRLYCKHISLINRLSNLSVSCTGEL